jgi:spermidine/putrescine transport system substrate-binding protein
MGPEDDPAPASIGSWPPATDADTTVLRSVYDGWLSWAEPPFRERTGVGINNWGDPVRWDVHRSDGDALSPVLNPLSDAVVDPVVDRVSGLGGESAPTEAIDVVDVRPGWLEMGVENDLVAPLPTESMPAWENVPDELRDGPHRQDGRTYGLPTVTVLSTLVYDTDAFESPPDSWGVLWDEAHRGNVVVGGAYWDLPLVAALYTGQNPRDPDDFEAVGEALETLRAQAGSTSTPSEALEAVTTGDATVGLLRQSTAYRARFERGAAVDYTVPSEGSVYKCFYHLIPKAAPNPMAALRLVNWLARPEASAPLFRREGVVPAVEAGDNLPAETATYLRWDDDWTLHNVFPLPESLSAPYGQLLRDAF